MHDDHHTVATSRRDADDTVAIRQPVGWMGRFARTKELTNELTNKLIQQGKYQVYNMLVSNNSNINNQ